jgi:biopolymer transport protein ExbD
VNFVDAQDNDEIEFNLIPLIDVILTLLIFFMVTTTFDQRSMLKVDLPEASDQATEAISQGLTVIIDARGRYFVDTREVLRPDAQSLQAAIEDHVGVERGQTVIVRADANTPHQSVVTALDVIGRLGFARVSIATVPSGAGD